MNCTWMNCPADSRQGHSTGNNAPGMVFLSGGSALNETASALASLITTTHIITTFDSGGSTAALRKVLPIPAMGDIRSRLLALADKSAPGVAVLVDVLKFRLPLHATRETHVKELQAFSQATHPLMQSLDTRHQERVVTSLERFMTLIPPSFQWSGASIGNLVLAADYFAFGKRFLPAIDQLARELHVRGRVLPVAETPAHLAVRLANGNTLVGQHRFTGKWEADISSPIERMWLTRDKGRPYPLPVGAGEEVCDTLTHASAIVYPIGSFFSSVAANLLVKGLGLAIAGAECKKVFIPNPGRDPELCCLSLLGQVEFLLRLLRADAPEASAHDLVSAVLVDRERGNYQGGIPDNELNALGIAVVDRPLLSSGEEGAGEDSGERRIQGQCLAYTLLTLFP